MHKATILSAMLYSVTVFGQQSKTQDFPAQQQNSQQQIQASFPKSNYGASNYSGVPQSGFNGMAPLPAPHQNTQAAQASQAIAPVSEEEIINLRNKLEGTRRARAYQPV